MVCEIGSKSNDERGTTDQRKRAEHRNRNLELNEYAPKTKMPKKNQRDRTVCVPCTLWSWLQILLLFLPWKPILFFVPPAIMRTSAFERGCSNSTSSTHTNAASPLFPFWFGTTHQATTTTNFQKAPQESGSGHKGITQGETQAFVADISTTADTLTELTIRPDMDVPARQPC